MHACILQKRERSCSTVLGKADAPEDKRRGVLAEGLLIYVYIISPLLCARAPVLPLYRRLGSDSGNLHRGVSKCRLDGDL